MAVPLVAPGTAITAAHLNAAALAFDAACEALFSGCSPLLFLPLSGSPSWRESKLSGLLFVFGANPRRIIAGEPSHDQATLDALAASASLRAGPNQQDHTLKQVTLNVPSDAFDKSLRVQRRTFTVGPDTFEDYFVRAFEFDLGGTEYFIHEHHHELAVIDVVLEGYTSSTFNFQVGWDKFDCVRIHNLDPGETPVEVTFEGTPNLVFDLPRWACVTVRRKGTTWEKQGFVLFRARDSDLARFGGTMPWLDRGATSAPWATLRDSDMANNVASVAALWRWIDYLSVPSTPSEVLSGCGGGLQGAFEPRTGIWFDLTTITNRASVQGLPAPGEPATPLWRLATHGGTFILAKQSPADPDPVDPAITIAAATLDELMEGGLPHGLKLDYDGGSLFVKVEDDGGLSHTDFYPLSANFTGGVPLEIISGEPRAISPLASVIMPNMLRATVAGTEVTIVNGSAAAAYLEFQILGPEQSSSGIPVNAYAATVGGVQGWTFTDGSRGNDQSTFTLAGTAWDGRRFVAFSRVMLAPMAGQTFSDSFLSVLMGANAEPMADHLVLGQVNQVMVYPSGGGIWGIYGHPRRAWTPEANDTRHPHNAYAFGEPEGGDWVALPTTQSPLSGITRTEAKPSAVVNYLWGQPGYKAGDSAIHLAESGATGAWWTENRAALFAGTPVDGETRPVVALPLMHQHWNALAARLNAIREVVPFTFLDALWYGKPFRPPVGRAGIYGGHVYPAGHLANAPSGSDAATRAADLSIPIRDFATEFPDVAALETAEVDGVRFDGSTHTAFEELNLLNDLLHWFNPELEVDFGEITYVKSGETHPGYTAGELIPPTEFGYRWFGTTNAEAVVPDLKWVTVEDVAAAAAGLGIPFRLERLALPLKVKVFTPDRIGPGVRRPFPLNQGIAVRTQAMLVSDSAESPQFEAYAGRTGNPDDFLWWAPMRQVRLSDWHPNPGTLGSDDAEVVEALSSPSHGISPFALIAATNPSHQVFGFLDMQETWFGNSPFTGEAPRVRIQVFASGVHLPADWTHRVARLMALPVGVPQWQTDIVSASPPAVGPRWHAVSGLTALVVAEDLFESAGGEDWDGLGGFHVALWGGAVVAPPITT